MQGGNKKKSAGKREWRERTREDSVLASGARARGRERVKRASQRDCREGIEGGRGNGGGRYHVGHE